MRKWLLVSGLLYLSSFGVAHAGVLNSTLYDTPTDSSPWAITLDFWYFQLPNDGTVTFDILSWEEPNHDLNGDGEFAFTDSMIWLFDDDGNLDASDLIAQNDDSYSTFGDGSISSLDSYLSVSLSAGNYVLMVGSCCDYGANNIDFPNQVQNMGYLYGYDSSGNWGGNWDDAIDHGDYLLTYSDNLVLTNGIPEPATLALLGLGMTGLAFVRRRRNAAC